MSKFKTIIVIGAGKILPTTLIEEIHHSHGMDMEVISFDQAKEKGIIPKIPPKPFILENLPVIELPKVFYDKHQAKNDCKKGWRNR